MSSIGSHSGNQRPVPHQQAPLAVPVIIIFSCEYPAAILTVPLTDHGVGTSYPQQSQPGRRSLAKSSIFGFIFSPAFDIHARYALLSYARPFPGPMPVFPARCKNMFGFCSLRSARVTG